MPNKNQTEKSNLNSGMIEPKLCTFRKTSMTRYTYKYNLILEIN